MAARFDLADDFKTRLAAMQHLKNQGFHAGEGDTFTHHQSGATALIVSRKATEPNGRTLIAYDELAKANERKAA